MIRDKLKGKRAFIFDFDGTLFHLFTTFNFDREIKMLDKEFKRLGFKFPDTWNPFEAFKVANDPNNSNSEEALIFSDRLLTECELRYLDLGTPVKGAVEVIKYLMDNDYSVSIATNNSPLCVEKFINEYLNGYNIPVVGRIGTKPDLLKPNPWMLEELMRKMGSKPSESIFFGDHPRDMDCANRAGIQFIPVTPADYKLERMLKMCKREEILLNLEELLNLIG